MFRTTDEKGSTREAGYPIEDCEHVRKREGRKKYVTRGKRWRISNFRKISITWRLRPFTLWYFSSLTDSTISVLIILRENVTCIKNSWISFGSFRSIICSQWDNEINKNNSINVTSINKIFRTLWNCTVV